MRCDQAGQVAYRRTVDGLVRGERPDAAAARLAGHASGVPGQEPVVHSTSWRCEPDGGIVLTYVVAPDPLPAEPAVPLLEFGIARGARVSRPSPEAVEVEQVASHALRHLAFLHRTDPHVRRALTDQPALETFLTDLPRDVAGQVPAS